MVRHVPPQGLNDFRPLMTTAKVERVQGYFLVIGAGEGALRTEVLPGLEQRAALDPRQITPGVTSDDLEHRSKQ